MVLKEPVEWKGSYGCDMYHVCSAFLFLQPPDPPRKPGFWPIKWHFSAIYKGTCSYNESQTLANEECELSFQHQMRIVYQDPSHF